MVNRAKLIITVLVLLVVVLAGILLFTLVISPAISGYTVNAQQQGIEFALISIMQRAANCEAVPLTYQNTTINLVAVECLQQGQTQGTGTQTQQTETTGQ